MVFDTNLIIHHIRQQRALPAQAVLSVVVIGEVKH